MKTRKSLIFNELQIFSSYINLRKEKYPSYILRPGVNFEKGVWILKR